MIIMSAAKDLMPEFPTNDARRTRIMPLKRGGQPLSAGLGLVSSYWMEQLLVASEAGSKLDTRNVIAGHEEQTLFAHKTRHLPSRTDESGWNCTRSKYDMNERAR